MSFPQNLQTPAGSGPSAPQIVQNDALQGAAHDAALKGFSASAAPPLQSLPPWRSKPYQSCHAQLPQQAPLASVQSTVKSGSAMRKEGGRPQDSLFSLQIYSTAKSLELAVPFEIALCHRCKPAGSNAFCLPGLLTSGRGLLQRRLFARRDSSLPASAAASYQQILH